MDINHAIKRCLRQAPLVSIYLLSYLAGTPVWAADNQPLVSCTVLDDEQKRLICYDTVAGRAAPVTGDQPVESEVIDNTSLPNLPAGIASLVLPETAEDTPVVKPSLLAKRWYLLAQTDRGPFVLTSHRPSYVLPVSYNSRPNDEVIAAEPGAYDFNNTEIKFQISFKAKIWPSLLSKYDDLWFGYTQLSFWQAYKSDQSGPFRETNYEPELIYAWRTNYPLFGLRGRVATIGINHQSNGRSDPSSRSWNRITAGLFFDRGENFAVTVRAWQRLPEAGEDDNPHIERYLGRGELSTHYRHGKETFSVMLRGQPNLEEIRGAIQLDWTHPLGKSPMQGYVQYFVGYGDGLIDYDHVSNRLGVGIMLTDWI